MRHALIALSVSYLTAASAGCGGIDEGQPPGCIVDVTSAGGLIVNELMAANAASLIDADGFSFDWIELFNLTEGDISLCGWSLTDRLDEPQLAVIEHDLIVPARGHVVLSLAGDEADAFIADHVAIHLDANGGELGLARPDGVYADRLIYGRQVVDVSAARERDGSDVWRIEWNISPGAANADAEPLLSHVEDLAAPPEVVPAAGDLTERILGYDEMPELDLRLQPDEIAALEADPYTYVPGHVVYDGREYGPIGIRLKGQNSFEPIDAKPSFRINIDEYVGGAKLLGLDDLTLNNMHSDFSMMHERLAYLVARQLGPASRSNHAVVSVNDEPYGLYANVETVKRHMIARWFDDPSGALFEATDVDFVVGSIEDFELESGPDDRALLIGLAEALDIASPEAAIAAATEYLDLDAFLSYWSMCAVVGQFDAFPYSNPGDDYFVYADPGSGKLVFLPWGMDETFYSGEFDIWRIHSILAETCAAAPSCLQQFVDRAWEALELIETMDLAAERTRVVEQIAAHAAADGRKPYDDATVAEFQTQLRWFIEGRRANLSSMLPPQSTP